ncbi:MAG: hypothetical protein AB7K04_08485 [Pseudorhodoplanes sp.]
MITLRGGDYEHILDLTRHVKGFEIGYEASALNPLFARMIAERAYEVCEFSLANYIMLKDRGADWLTAIPVFPYRAFRHGALFVRTDSPLTNPSQLSGRTVAVPDYSMTAAGWARGIFRDRYGLKWSDINWHSGTEQRFPTPAGVKLTRRADDLEQAVIDGKIDALLTTGIADEKRSPADRRLRTLLPDAEEAERAYHQETGIYPIHHTVVVRSDTLKSHPGLPRALFDAYAQAKANAYQRRLGATLVPWGLNNWKKQFAAFGGDPLPYGLTDLNIKVVLKLAEYLLDQKLIGAMPDVSSLFLKDTESWRG